MRDVVESGAEAANPERPAAPPGPAVLTVEDVSVCFGGHAALRHVTVEAADHRITVLSGPSGSGKTTLLRLCNRLEVPTEGRVAFRGEDLTDLDPLALRRRVGMGFQRPTLFPGTLCENFEVATPSDHPAFEAALVAVGLPAGWLDRPAEELSGGEAQRACLARTLLTRPEVLLMDEPTSSLDHEATRLLEDLGVGLARQGLAIVWVSHDLDQARRIADETIVLIDGEVADPARSAAYLAGAGSGEAEDR